MAITKIKAIKNIKGGAFGVKRTINAQIEYICNVKKTDNGALISCYECTNITAATEFLLSASSTNQRKNANIAYHLKQSFAPGEVSAEEAHQIGIEYAEAILKGKFQYVLSTHIDQNHIHNHLIFCATSFQNQKKYNDCTRERYFRERENDRICKEHHLSVIKEKSGKKGYRIWKGESGKREETNRRKIEKIVLEAADKTDSYGKFVLFLQNAGVELRDDGNDFAYRLNGSSRYVRAASIKTVDGDGNIVSNPFCSRKNIMQKLLQNAVSSKEKFMPKADRKMLIFEVTETVNRKKSEYAKYKNDLDTLEKMIKTLNYLNENEIKTDTEMEEQISDMEVIYDEARKKYEAKKQKLHELSIDINYAKTYWKYKKIYEQGQKSGGEELADFIKAKGHFEGKGMSEKELGIKKMLEQHKKEKEELAELKRQFDETKENCKKVAAVKSNCEIMMGRKIERTYDQLRESFEREQMEQAEQERQEREKKNGKRYR